jgi:site-specific DNA-methyltransferase (adenine-specific)
MARAPGSIRDAILAYMSTVTTEASVAQIRRAISAELGDVPPSSIRSYLNLNTPRLFVRLDRGIYRLVGRPGEPGQKRKTGAS